MSFDRSADIIELLRRKLGLDDDLYTVMRVWDQELGPLASFAKIAAVKRGQLIVEVASSVHFQELNMRRRDLIGKLNQYFGGRKVVKGIKLCLGGRTGMPG